MGPFELVKKELENCVIQKGKEAVFRSKAKWITKIKFEGNCISDQDNILREIKH